MTLCFLLWCSISLLQIIWLLIFCFFCFYLMSEILVTLSGSHSQASFVVIGWLSQKNLHSNEYGRGIHCSLWLARELARLIAGLAEVDKWSNQYEWWWVFHTSCSSLPDGYFYSLSIVYILSNIVFVHYTWK